ncbi:hypothetical protein [Runella slithyformis]|uniref:Uncharacterized protein n=1 Tax=Runella slithyformis (strain ATCC 29530 / DSM 19594 / LMG 11500 / NCIMB 11436 / LSU 4) TaxID=761193 RepID=A0A7U4E746_RUNSL|nr:hypothetical protein [Runella slithyformis]AEI50276.1 hypothetical protein Runsl_3920 [Runella slithyformis DSM 19594]
MKPRHIKKAFEYFGYECPDEIIKESDLKMEIEDSKQAKHSLLVAIETAQEHMKKLDDWIDLLESVKQQVKAEEYRELNPHAKDVFFIN